MILDAEQLASYQLCKRKLLLSADYRPAKWLPRSLFNACLRRAIVSLSAGVAPGQVATDAVAGFLEIAADPGLNVPYGANPYNIAKEWCAMLETIPRALGRITLLTLHEMGPVRLNSSLSWQPSAWADESGVMHRWITVDRWTQGDLAREGHGWYVMGDVAITRTPMMLHVVEIGSQRDGRRASDWARGWKHPGLASLAMRFRHADGEKPKGWKAVYLADQPYADYDEWVDQMWREGVVEQLVHHIEITVPPDSVCDDTTRQVMQEAIRMREMLEERGSIGHLAVPMSRGACDLFIPCEFQEVCYSVKPVDPAATGLYQIRSAERDKVTA
jgi:hypothetical protein